jgi:hypothetical protein
MAIMFLYSCGLLNNEFEKRKRNTQKKDSSGMLESLAKAGCSPGLSGSARMLIVEEERTASLSSRST